MPWLGSRRLHRVVILTKYLLTTPAFSSKCEQLLTQTILLSHLSSESQHHEFSWRCSHTSVNWLSSIFVGMESGLPFAYAEGSPRSNQQRGQLCCRTSQHCRCILHSTAARHQIDLSWWSYQWLLSIGTGAPCREVNAKVATAPSTQSRR